MEFSDFHVSLQLEPFYRVHFVLLLYIRVFFLTSPSFLPVSCAVSLFHPQLFARLFSVVFRSLHYS